MSGGLSQIQARQTPWPAERMLDHLVLPAEALGTAIDRLAAEDALSLPVLSEPLRAYLLEESAHLTYRPARPVVGRGDKAVFQDFELCMSFAEASPFRTFARALDRLTWAALAGREELLQPGFTYNDLIVQRYEPGCAGITPHRDHIAYEGLVSLVILSGEADFLICADRAGTGEREIASPEGSLLLMRGAGFAGLRTRPFHLLRNVRTRRVSFGLRYDIRTP
jgi:hypothetical protein